MLYIFDNSTDPYWNLAAEEYLLKSHNEPIFRLWRNSNAIIVGHYQNTLAEIDIDFVKENNIKVVRRITGGGAVFHDLGNINFTFIEDKKPLEDASAMFKRFTQPIIDAINSLGIHAYLEGRNDLLIDGAKFSGNAVCIYKNRVLQHGTLLYSASMNSLAGALKNRPEKFVGKAVQSNRSRVTNISSHLTDPLSVEEFKEYILNFIMQKYNGRIYEYTSEDLEAIGKLRDEKYIKDSWNYGVSPSYSFRNVKKLSGGIVEVYFNVEKGNIKNLQIFGDYFFTAPTENFISEIENTPHSIDALKAKLEEIDNNMKKETPLGIEAYFNAVSQKELLSMFFN